MKFYKRLLSVVMITLLVLLLASCSGGGSNGSGSSDSNGKSADGATASEMKLEDLQGTVAVSDGTQDVESFAGMNLYNGYSVGTEAASYSWIMLDAAKLIKMNEYSHTSISQDGRSLKVTLDDGDVFFCVTEPLDDDEELVFETDNMTMSVRGTTGIIRRTRNYTVVVMLEGEAELHEKGEEDWFTNASAGSTYVVTDEDIINYDITNGDVPGFAMDELLENEAVRAKTEPAGVRTDYMTDEELRKAAETFEGTYTYTGYMGTGKTGDDDVDFNIRNAYTLELSVADNGRLIARVQESDEAKAEIDSFNQRMNDLNNDYRFEHIGSNEFELPVRMDNETTLDLFDFGITNIWIERLFLQDDGNLSPDEYSYTEYNCYQRIR